MAIPEPSGPGSPDLFRALFQIFSDPQRFQWDLAAELARQIASENESTTNVDPVLRIKLEELYRVAEMQVGHATGLDTTVAGKIVVPEAVSPSDWARRTLEDWKPLLTVMAAAHSQPISMDEESTENIPPVLAQVIGQAVQAIGPAMLGIQLGSSIGYLARRAFGQYDLPIPRPARERVLFVPSNITAFAEDWSLPVDDVCLWVCMREIAHHCVVTMPHVSARILELLEDYAHRFSPDRSGIEERLAALDLTDIADVGELQKAFGDPSEILAGMVTPEQNETAERISAIVCALEGWVDHVMDSVGTSLIGSYGPLTEALRRRRVEREEGERYVDVLFGMALDRETFSRGSAFVSGVVDREGEDALVRLWSRPEHLPTPAEIDAPGLWLERISFVE